MGVEPQEHFPGGFDNNKIYPDGKLRTIAGDPAYYMDNFGVNFDWNGDYTNMWFSAAGRYYFLGYYFDTFNLSPAASTVPEPATPILITAGIGVLALLRKRFSGCRS